MAGATSNSIWNIGDGEVVRKTHLDAQMLAIEGCQTVTNEELKIQGIYPTADYEGFTGLW